ncbi:hypothetical protein DMUE_3277 [Dictyocoela muelleri]|nr:hypothetical protein DMUE_3277 [Dictyocoela muelleri]
MYSSNGYVFTSNIETFNPLKGCGIVKEYISCPICGFVLILGNPSEYKYGLSYRCTSNICNRHFYVKYNTIFESFRIDLIKILRLFIVFFNYHYFKLHIFQISLNLHILR